ncbi:MAG TPA: glycosyltransferase 87 family protein [Terriglobales bacterium]|nr:glycosyltransferase 87 family protein [Terriglobales bacterium]
MPQASVAMIGDRKDRTSPAGRVIAVLAVAQWVVFQVLLRSWDRVEVAARFFLGNDFAYLYNAAGLFLSGKSPYGERNFIPLPPALYLPMALHHLASWNALIAFRTINFVLVVAAMLWLCRELKLNLLNSALVLVITVTYGPFYSLLAGGNLDGLMLVLMVLACARRVWLRGAFLGFSIGTKLYSALLLPVLLLRRRWREALWAIVVLGVAMLPFVAYWPEAFSSVLHRSSTIRLGSTLRLDGNESPAVLFILLFGQTKVWLWRSCYVALWGGTLLMKMVADWADRSKGEEERFRGLEYLPWMAAAPLLVFTYTGTILLPLMALLIRKNQERGLSWAEWVIGAGFVPTGLYPVVLSQLLPRGQYVATITMVAAPLGIAAMMVGMGAAAVRHG